MNRQECFPFFGKLLANGWPYFVLLSSLLLLGSSKVASQIEAPSFSYRTLATLDEQFDKGLPVEKPAVNALSNRCESRGHSTAPPTLAGIITTPWCSKDQKIQRLAE